MALFAIADVHLSLGTDKPMDVFGPAWENHVERLEAAWTETVSDEDTVLMPGDISWAMDFEQLLPDLRFLDQLPGKKILGRGNHDYWWSTRSRMERMAGEQNLDSLIFMKNNAFLVEGTLLAGSRGWLLPWDSDCTAQDEKVMEREKNRMRLSFEAAVRLERDSGKPADRTIALLHYPPTDRQFRPSPYTDIIQEYGCSVCVYGHLHGIGARYGPQGYGPQGIRYVNVSADRLAFRPFLL